MEHVIKIPKPIRVQQPTITPRIKIVDPQIDDETMEDSQKENIESQAIEDGDMRVDIVNGTFHAEEVGDGQRKESLQVEQLVDCQNRNEILWVVVNTFKKVYQENDMRIEEL